MNDVNTTSPSVVIENNPKQWVALVVDDQIDNLSIVKAALSFYGVEVHSAKNGGACLEILRNLHPTFVLLDISMPVMDGWETLRRIRTDHSFTELPVIALTAHAMEGDRQRVLDSGFNGYIAKPFDVQTLARDIWRIIGPVFASPSPATTMPGA